MQSHRSGKHVRRLAVGLALAALALGQGLARAAEIAVAQVAPLSGVLASTGQQMVLGGKIYFDWVNAHGGINGARIRHIVVDDAYKVDETVRLAREVPLGRLVTAREDARFAVYLCSSDADCFVGQVFPVCGGWVAR